MLTPTHMFFALALAYIFRLPKLTAFLAGLVIDLDIIFNILGFGFPLVHRGIMHTPLFILAITAIWYYGRKKSRNALAFGAGALGHLFIDFFTDEGVMLLYPLGVFFALPVAGYANLFANIGISLLSIGMVLLFHYKPGFLGEERKNRVIAFAVFILLCLAVISLSVFFPFQIWEPFVGYY